MFGALTSYLIFLLNTNTAIAGHRDVTQEFLSQAWVTESSPEDLTAYVASVQEWNQLISQKFRDIPEAALARREPCNFESMGDRLNALEFGALNTHLAALHRTRRVRKFLLAQVRKEKLRLLALVDSSSVVASSAAPGLLEGAHSQLAMTYPDLFADQLNVTASHPVAVLEAPQPLGHLDSATVGSKPLVSNQHPIRSYVEAFDSQRSVLDASSELLSKEPEDTGWLISSSYEHLPTLEWVGDAHRDLETPLISENTALILGTLAGVTLQKDSGIVFGKLAANWKIEFSGRSETPLYLDANLKPVNGDDFSVERYFILLNVAPGGHMVYLNPSEGPESGAVAFPVLAATATYLDLTKISYTQMKGQVVLSDELEGNLAVPKATIRLVEQPAVAGVTSRKGHFHFDHVMVVSDYPLFVETDQGPGFTHRYRVLPKNLNHLLLYRLPEHQINDWIGQIQEGVSNESGLVLAAVPGLTAKEVNRTLVPSIRSIIPTMRMIPETYTLTPADLLQPRTALESDENRFLGVEIPEGPVLVQLTDENQAVVWSELTFVSPNVVTLVGPY